MKRVRLAFVAAIIALSVSRIWAETENVNGITWTYSVKDGEAVLGGGSYSEQAVPTSTAGELSIPEALGGFPVRRVGPYAFYNCGSLTSVVVPVGVRSVDDYAFSYCSLLTSVTLPDGLTSIGNGAFLGCTSLDKADLPNGLVTIGQSAYYNCTSLKSVTMPDSVISIGERAFGACSGLQDSNGFVIVGGVLYGYFGNSASVIIPNNVTTISGYAFYDCRSLKSVSIPEGVTRIGSYAFYCCSSLSSISIPKNVASIGSYAFSSCTSIAEVNISDLAKWCEIRFEGSYANPLEYAHHLVLNGAEITELVIPDGVKWVGDYAFKSCTLLNSVSMPDSVERVGVSAFAGCNLLSSVNLSKNLKDIGDTTFSSCSSLTAVEIPEGTTNIGNSAFNACSKLTKVVIPRSVTRIGNNSFYSCYALTAVDIPEGVKEIGSYAFYNCSALTAVDIPEGVTEIGSYAFYYCSKLTEVSIPSSVKSMGAYAFGSCNLLASVAVSDLAKWCEIRFDGIAFSTAYSFYQNGEAVKELVIPSGVTSVKDYAFYKCASLTSLTIPEGVTSIGNSAFSGCTSLSRVAISKSVTSISDSAFSNCNALRDNDGFVIVGDVLYNYLGNATDLVIPDGVSSISPGAFQSCRTIISVVMPDSVTNIGNTAFNGCTSLSSLTLSNNIRGIGSSAFQSCTSLTSVNIPESVTSIGSYAFNGCNKLTSVHIADLAKWCAINFGGSNANPFQYAKQLYVNGGEVTSLAIPDGVTTVNAYAFQNCGSITSVTMPDSVTSVGMYAFQNCSSLSNVSLSRGLKSIPASAFANSKLSDVEIPEGVANLEGAAFQNCASLVMVKIPNTVTNIGSSAFSGCSALPAISIPESVISIGSSAFYGCRALTSVVIPDSVTSIGSSAFSGCSSLTTASLPVVIKSIASSLFSSCSSLSAIRIPEGVTTIWSSAFYGCAALVSIEIPDSVKSIESSAFRNCTSLKGVELPDGLTSLGGYAYQGCSSLTSVAIPKDVKSIADYTFADCSSLQSVEIVKGVESVGNYAFSGCIKLDEVKIPDSVTSIGNYAFYNCTSLKSVTIPDSVVHIGTEAFEGCPNLSDDEGFVIVQGVLQDYFGSASSVKIPDGVTSIGDKAFRDCTSVTMVSIPTSVTNIGSQAFYNCSSLSLAAIPGNVVNIGANAFQNCGSLAGVVMFEGVSNIRDGAFQNCGSLKKVLIAGSVSSIGNNAFQNCTALEEVVLAEGVANIGSYAFQNCTSLRSMEIPKSVTSVGGYAFQGCKQLTSVLIPTANVGSCAFQNCTALVEVRLGNGVTSIGSYAFQNCGLMVSLELPDSVTSVGSYAFSGCSGLSSIVLSKNLKKIDSYSFNNCGSLKTIEIPSSVEVVGDRAFYGCSSLNSVIMSEGVGSIGNYAFYNCRLLHVAEIPNTVKSIGDYAFYNCEALAAIKIPDGVVRVGDSTFYNCHSLRSVIIPKGVTSIGYAAFYGCSLTSVMIPEGVESIGGYAFYGCSKLTSMAFPASLSHIGHMAFYHSSIGEVHISDLKSWSSLNFDNNYDNPLYHTHRVYLGEEEITQLDIPEGTLSIGSYAYCCCKSISSVTIPNSVTNIGEGAFWECGSLKSISISSGVKNIGKWAFLRCSSLTLIEIPAGVTSIDYGAFEDCDSLITVTIHGDVESIGSQAFSGCSSLRSVTLPNGLVSIGSSAFSGCKALEGILLPSSVKIIGDSAFSGCSSLCELEIPSRVESIGGGAFSSCSSLVSMVLPEGIDRIGHSMFSGCTSLNSITIPNSVTNIGGWAFSRCSSLTMLEIPNGVISIDEWAFQDCTALTSVFITDLAKWCAISFARSGGIPLALAHHLYLNGEEIKDLVIPDGVENIADYAFYGGTNFDSVTIPNSVTNIGRSAFYGCSGIKSVKLSENLISIEVDAFGKCSSLSALVVPDSVLNIGNSAFYGCSSLTFMRFPKNLTSIAEHVLEDCTSLTSLEIPEGVTNIGYGAFRRCSSLKSIVLPETLCGIGSSAFSGCSSLSSITLPDAVAVIGSSAFSGCSSLSSITLPDAVAVIGSSAFSGCSSLSSITLPEQITTIESYTFSDNSSLASVTIHDGVTKVEYAAFQNCPIEVVFVDNEPADLVKQTFGSSVVYQKIGEEVNYEWSTYTNGNGELMVTGVKPEYGDIVIPPEIDGRKVMHIGSYAFSGAVGLTSVTIPNGVVSIEARAFSGCTGLVSVDIPNTVRSIGSYAFSECKKLSEARLPEGLSKVAEESFSGSGVIVVDVPKGVTSIGPRAFADCRSLTSLSLNAGLTSVEKSAFTGCCALEAISLPNGLVSIGSSAFSDCCLISSVQIPKSVTSIGDSAFSGCTSLASVKIPSGLTKLNYNVFLGCYSLSEFITDSDSTVFSSRDGLLLNKDGTTLVYCPPGLSSVSIPEGVTHIGGYAFYGCRRLKSVTMPRGLTNIGEWAFYYCSSLEAVVIPDDVVSIGSYAFDGCSEMTAVTIPTGVRSIGVCAFSGCYSLTKVEIPGSVNEIAGSTFSYCRGLMSVTIADGVKSIGAQAFWNCDSLASLTTPSSVTTIGKEAFSKCLGLVSASLADGLTTIGEKAFYSCTNLTSVSIPASVDNIGKEAFSACDTLSSVQISDLSKWCEIVFNGADANPLTNAHHLYLNGVEVKEAFIPDDVTGIGDYAFYGCSGLTSVVIPDTVKSIGKYAFYGCKDILSLSIGNGVSSIGTSAFYGCRGLKSLEIPNSLTSIGQSVFQECSGLESVSIPEGVTSIGWGAFYDCEGLQTVEIPETVVSVGDCAFYNCSGLKSVKMPKTVNSIGSSVFFGCDGLTSMTIPEGVTSIDSYAFYGCGGIQSVVIPSSVTSIENCAFYGCTGLVSVIMSDSLNRIGSSAFYGCSGLTSVSMPKGVTSVGENAFAGCSGLTAVHVSDLAKWCEIKFANSEANPLSCARHLYLNGEIVSELVIPDGVKSIGPYAFYTCSDITSVRIPNGVTSVGNYAFYGCDSLNSLMIGDEVANLGYYAFNSCGKLETIMFGGRPPSCNTYCFQGSSPDVLVIVKAGTDGWGVVPGVWNGMSIIYDDYAVNVQAVDMSTGGWSDVMSLKNEMLMGKTTWVSGKCYVVDGTLMIGKSGLLEIEPGVIVKMKKDAQIRVVDGGLCVAKGVTFTHIADDDVGGDVNGDGSITHPVKGEYKIIGNVAEDYDTKYRYYATYKLDSYIYSATRLQSGRVYLAESSVTIASGATLAIPPGAIIKFARGCSMAVYGSLDAQGTRAAPVVFTCSKDDSSGGDTDGDGGKSDPQPGDWGNLIVYGSAKFKFVDFLYGSGASTSTDSGMISISDGGSLSLENCRIMHGLYDGIFSYGIVTAENSVIYDCDRGVNTSGGSGVFRNCVVDLCRWGVMSEGGSGSYYNSIITRFYGSSSWQTGWGVAFWSGSLNTYNCDVWSDLPGSSNYRSSPGAENNFSSDPMFVDPDNCDFRIDADSPCVDAGDWAEAPELDYYGQPRMNVKRVTDTGVPNEDGICPDIGIYEFPGETTVPVSDLSVQSVIGPSAATPGEEITVTYAVTNGGVGDAVGVVRDYVVMKGAEAGLGGQEIAIGVVEQSYMLSAGASATFMARVKCPTAKSGKWLIGMTVNSDRDVFERNFGNNAGWASVPTEVELEEVSNNERSTTVLAGAAKGFTLGSGLRIVRVSGGSALADVKVYGANGAVPLTAEDGISAVRLDDDSLLLVLPEREVDEKAYVVIENTGSAAVEVKLSADTEKLNVLDVLPNRVAAVDGVSVTITGVGLSDVQTVKLGGRNVKSVSRINDMQIVAAFDLKGVSPGMVDLTVDGGSAGDCSLPVEVYKVTQGAKLEASLELPISVRDGRIFTAYVVYANVGDEPMAMPVFKVERADSTTKLGLRVEENLTETRVFVGGISLNHPAGVLQPGDGGRIPVYFQPFGAYKLKLSHTKETDNTEQFAAFGGVKSYLVAMSSAATRLNLRGRAEYNVHDFVDQATWEKEGYDCAAVSGYLRDAMTREPIAQQVISLVATNENVATVVRATTDEKGYFQIRNVPDGDYRWMLDVANAQLPLTVVTVKDQCDVNDVTVLVSLAGRVSGHAVTTDGFPLYGATVVLYGAEGHVQQKTVTDDFGAFIFEGVPEGAYSVRCASIDGYVCTSVEDVIVDAVTHAPVVELTLAPGGRISGTVSSGDGQICGGTVAAITEGGDVLEVQCEADGTYLFDGLPAGNYTMQFYSTEYLAEGPSVALTVGDDVQVDLVAQERPLFVATSTMGFGSLTTSFVLVDKTSLTNVTAWAWDFDDDGKVDSTEAEPTWTYRSLGTNTVSLTITTAEGEEKVSRFKDCCIVEKPLETIYKSGAIVYGVNYGTLSVVSEGANTIRMSGHPAEGELAVGRAILGKAGEEWFLYRILSAKQDGDEWVLGVEEGKMTDIYEQCSIAVSSTVVVEDDRPVLKSVSPTSKPKFAAASTPAPEPIPLEDENGFKVFAQGGLKVTTEVHPKISLDMREVIINGEVVSERTAFVGSLNFDYVFEGYGELGAKYEAKLGVPLIPIGTPTPVPGVTFDASAELYAILQASAKGSIYAPGRLVAAIQVGREVDRHGNVRWLPPAKINNQPGDIDMNASGNFLVQIGLKPSFNVRAFLTASFGAAIDFYVKGEGSFTTSATAEFEESVGMNVDYELNLIDWEFKWVDIKVGAELEYEVAKYVFARYVAPTPDFIWTPYNPDPGEEVKFLTRCEDGFVEVFGKRRPVPPSGYRWNIGGSTAEYKDLKTHFAREGRYPASLKVKGGYIVGPFADEHTVTVGKPEDIPADGESQNDDQGGGNPVQSWDPNEIAGLVGSGDPDTQRVVKPGEWMSYTIYFENKDSATADAQEVKVTNPLSEYLDWSSFEMGEVAFNNQIDLGLSGKQNAQHEEALKGTERSVRTTVSLDKTSGKVSWAMRIVDPKGLLGWPDDGGGFLPPNDSTHRGEGHLSYRIKVRDDAPAGVRIENAASIVFDYNEPIVTDPAWWNTVGQMVAVDGKTGSGVKSTIMVDPNWVKANVGAGATDAQIAEVLNGTGANGLKVWQSIALGLDSENAEDKFLVDVPQNDEVETVSVKALKGALPECAWMPIKYRLDADATGSGVATQGAAQDAADFGIDIGGADDPTGIYSVTAVFSDDEGSDFAEVLAANQIGILRKAAANKREIVPVPWTKFAAGAEDIAVSNLVKTAGLTAGDKLYVYDDSAKRYATWELQSDKTWKPVKTVKMVNGKLEMLTADSPEVATVKRGSGVWLERHDITKPIHFVGQHDAAPVEMPVEAGTTETPKWNLVASPLLTDWDLNSVSEGVNVADRIIVPTGKEPRIYTRDATNAKWGYITYEANAKGIVKPVRKEDDTMLKAGTGFWYVSEGGAPTLRWREASEK